ncbi:MAG: DUF222 domain-containing protein [Microbacteriaceae bacterium]
MTALLEAAGIFARSVAVSQAAQLTAVHEVIVTARRNPGVYVSESSETPRLEAVSLAARAVVMDLSLRLSLPEGTIWSQFHEADTLMQRLPRLWTQFCSGAVGYPNAREAATVAWSLPHDNPAAFAELDDALVEKAERLTPSQFRKAARAARERVHPEDATRRHREARQERRVEVSPANDGMAWLSLFTDAATIMKVDARLNAAAKRQRGVDGESRTTLAQLRVDAAGDVLTGRGTAFEVKAHVHLNTPVTAMLDHPELLAKARTDVAVLEGYGPIDDETARLLVADAPSFRRVFTDPITGIDLNMDRKRYRPTAAQREWLRRQHPECESPTCSIRIDDSDLDHTTDWQFDGLSNPDNLAPLSRGHHTLKHKTKITLTRTAVGRSIWRTPTGFSRETDPPPF